MGKNSINNIVKELETLNSNIREVGITKHQELERINDKKTIQIKTLLDRNNTLKENLRKCESERDYLIEDRDKLIELDTKKTFQLKALGDLITRYRNKSSKKYQNNKSNIISHDEETLGGKKTKRKSKVYSIRKYSKNKTIKT